jgi:hypothetical protein
MALEQAYFDRLSNLGGTLQKTAALILVKLRLEPFIASTLSGRSWPHLNKRSNEFDQLTLALQPTADYWRNCRTRAGKPIHF